MSTTPNDGNAMDGTVPPADRDEIDSTEPTRLGPGHRSTNTEDKRQSSELQRFPIEPWRVAKYLGCIITGLVVGGAIANYSIYNIAPHPEHEVADVLKRFDLGHEPSIPAFYSAVVMLLAAATAAFLAVYDHGAQMRRRKSWLLLCFVLTLLAIDESVMFHEMGTSAMNRLGLSGSLHFSWVIPGSIFAAVAALAFSHLLFNLSWRTRLLFICSGVIFLSGAIGMEILGSMIVSSYASEAAAISSLAHVLSQAVEEALEMVGMGLFFCSLLDFIKLERISLWISTPPQVIGES